MIYRCFVKYTKTQPLSKKYTCSSSSLQESAHVIFQNTSAVQQFGVPRSSADHSNTIHSLSNEERQFRRNWILQIAQVENTASRVPNSNQWDPARRYSVVMCLCHGRVDPELCLCMMAVYAFNRERLYSKRIWTYTSFLGHSSMA